MSIRDKIIDMIDRRTGRWRRRAIEAETNDRLSRDFLATAERRFVRLMHEHDQRVAELLEVNNRYLQEARDARADVVRLREALTNIVHAAEHCGDEDAPVVRAARAELFPEEQAED